MFDCQIITSETDVAALATEWQQLHERVGASIFTDYGWFTSWRHTIGKMNERMVHIVTARSEGKLVGLLPLAVIRKKGFRILQMIGAESFFWADTLCEDAVCAQALWQVARQSPHYDFAHIRDVRPGSLCEQTLASFAALHDKNKALGLRVEWKSGAEWKASLSENFRKNIDKAMRQLNQKAPVRYEIFSDDPEKIDALVASMVKHKTAWCDLYGKEGVFDQEGIAQFFQQLAQQGLKDKSLRFATLACGETVIAWHLMFAYRDIIYSYVLAVDLAWQKYSPGNLAHVHAIMWSIDNGFRFFNHMQGDYAYKYKFVNQVDFCREYTFQPSLWGWFGAQLFIVRRNVQRYFHDRNQARLTAAAKHKLKPQTAQKPVTHG